MNIFTNIPESDQDWVLAMVLDAFKPFSARPIHVGDIAAEWVTRWRRAQPKSKRHAVDARVAMLNEAYRRVAPEPEQGEQFTFEMAVAAINERWPGIRVGEPERRWNAQPEIAELHRLRGEVQARDPNRYPHAVRAMVTR